MDTSMLSTDSGGSASDSEGDSVDSASSEEAALFTTMMGVVLCTCACCEHPERRGVERCEGGPLASTLAGYLRGDDATYVYNFSMTRANLERQSARLADQGFLCDNRCPDVSHHFPGTFKFAACMYVFRHGGGAGGYYKSAADAAGLGESTVEA